MCRQDLLPATGLGELVVTMDADGAAQVVQADPVIGVAGELLHDWHDGTPKWFSLECAGQPEHVGDVIRLEAADRHVVYVVTRRFTVDHSVWEARWPD